MNLWIGEKYHLTGSSGDYILRVYGKAKESEEMKVKDTRYPATFSQALRMVMKLDLSEGEISTLEDVLSHIKRQDDYLLKLEGMIAEGLARQKKEKVK